MLSNILARSGAVLATAALLAPVTAFAGSSTAAVAVSQSQWVSSPRAGFDVSQSADVSVGTTLNGVLSAHSRSAGSQQTWARGAVDQSQDLTAGASISWDAAGNAWAGTTGSVDQQQGVWSDKPIQAQQWAGTWQHSNVGATEATTDGTVDQSSVGAVGDVSQQQSISGSTQVDGQIVPPVPFCDWWCGPWGGWTGFGGRLETIVEVIVRNVLVF